MSQNKGLGMKRLFLPAVFFLLAVPFLSFADEADGDEASAKVETIGTADIIPKESEDDGGEEEAAESDDDAAEEPDGEGEGDEVSGLDEDENAEPGEPKLSFPKIATKPFLIFNYGVTYSQVTRIVYQDEYSRSNFVYQNHLIGLSFEARSVNIKPVDSVLRLAVYYPFYNTFNGMNQPSKQVILYAFDLFWGPYFLADMWKYVYVNFAIGPHFLYQLSDEYHHVEFGGAVLIGVELPLARRWTLLMNGLASLDYGNLGSNRNISPYDLVYNYQLEFGFRYSRKSTHEYSYLSR